MDILKEINNYFRYQKGKIGGFKVFKNTGLYEHYGNLFGPLVYTEDSPYDFIGVDKEGTLYDEIYYPQDNFNKVGTIIPSNLLEQDFKIVTPNPVWKEVSTKGYCELKNIKIDDELSDKALNEAYIPHGINPELNMAKSIFHAYFATLADYDQPEKHKYPDYMKFITEQVIPQIPQGQPIINNYVHHTADIVKYVYDPEDMGSIKGPYSFHMDYFARCLFMFFIYLAQNRPVVGRELYVGKRDYFKDFSAEALDLSPASQPDEEAVGPFERLSDDRVKEFDTIKIDHKKVVLMNTLNPMFVHKVEKLRKKNEIVLLTNYFWCKDWPKLD